MSVEQSSEAGEKAGHPVLMAVVVVMVILLSATLYTLVGSLMTARQGRAAQIAEAPAGALSRIGLPPRP